MSVKKMPFEKIKVDEYEDNEDMTVRLLFKSKDDTLYRGVLGGLAEYWNIDSTIVRLLFLLLTVITGGLFIIVYLILVKVIPEEP